MTEILNYLTDTMAALRPLARMYRHLSMEMRNDPNAVVTLAAGVALTVDDCRHAAELFERCSDAYKLTPQGAWSDTLEIRKLTGDRDC